MTDATIDRTTHEAFEAAYYDYLRELEGVGHELTQNVLTAQNAVRTAQMPPPSGESNEAHEKLTRDYGQAINSAWEGSQRRYADAYFAFLESFGKAWTSADRSHMSPPALAALAQSVAAVASHASATIGNMDIFTWTGVPMPAADDPNAPKTEESGSPKPAS
jgi:hypothetical protein